MKVKKQHRKKKYLHNVNRKRQNKKINSTGKVAFKTIKDAWDDKKSTNRNLREMGLSNDPNKAVKIPNYKQSQLKIANKFVKNEDSESEEEIVDKKPIKNEILKQLEKEAKAPTEKRFMLPKSQVEFVTYLMDKYGHDYKAMAKDKKNYYQATWKQIRQKIKTFMGIPKQYGAYLESRGLTDQDDSNIMEEAKAFVKYDSD